MHLQTFVQCLHQHTPLHTLLLEHRRELQHLFEDYAKYKAQVCRQIYADLPGWKDRQTETEQAWKQQYDSSTELIDTPALLTKTISPILARSQAIQTYSTERVYKSARVWLKEYLQNVQRQQEMRQNHVHVWNDKKKCKMPLTHCQCSDDSSKCKAGFPRTAWLIDKPVVLCKGFLKKRGMPYSGKKNMVGSVH